MSERPQYMTAARRGREQRYRRRTVRASVAAVVLHILLVPVIAPLAGRIPLVRRSGYVGEIRLLPEISVLREPAPVASDVAEMAGELAEASFEVVNLSISELELPHERSAETVVEELDLTIGDEFRDLLETSLPQPTGREIVIEHFVEPVYPQSAIDAGVEGVAVFGIQVAVTGDVVRAWLVDSDVSGSCNIEAQRALLQWRFAPYLVRGRPAPFLKHYRIRFCFRDDLAHGRRERLESESFSRP